MKAHEFDEIMRDLINHCENTLTLKAHEYADDFDRLHNFKVAADFMGVTPKQALFGFLAKHLVSLSDMCREDHLRFVETAWDEKIGDSINYLILLRAIVAEDAMETPSGVETGGTN